MTPVNTGPAIVLSDSREFEPEQRYALIGFVVTYLMNLTA